MEQLITYIVILVLIILARLFIKNTQKNLKQQSEKLKRTHPQAHPPIPHDTGHAAQPFPPQVIPRVDTSQEFYDENHYDEIDKKISEYKTIDEYDIDEREESPEPSEREDFYDEQENIRRNYLEPEVPEPIIKQDEIKKDGYAWSEEKIQSDFKRVDIKQKIRKKIELNKNNLRDAIIYSTIIDKPRFRSH
jgi:hypothetical protein